MKFYSTILQDLNDVKIALERMDIATLIADKKEFLNSLYSTEAAISKLRKEIECENNI